MSSLRLKAAFPFIQRNQDLQFFHVDMLVGTWPLIPVMEYFSLESASGNHLGHLQSWIKMYRTLSPLRILFESASEQRSSKDFH